MEWISVKDRLPERGVMVLLFDMEEYCYGIGYHHGRKSGFISHASGVYEVTHWTELPEPPVGSRIWKN